MKFNHSFCHHDVSEALMAYVEEGMHKLEKFDIKPSSVHVTYDLQRHLRKVEISLRGGEARFDAQSTSDDWYTSVDQVIAKLGRQMGKRKDIVKNHKSPRATRRTGRIDLLTEELDTNYSKLNGVSPRKAG